MIRMQTIRFFVLGTIAALAIPAAFAQQPASKKTDSHWYAVEVIVFRPTAATAGDQELWPADPRLPDTSNAVVPGSSESATKESPSDTVLPLPHDQYQLKAIRNRLKRSNRYQVLLHTGWIEPGLPRNKAPTVSITPLVTSTIPKLDMESYPSNSSSSPRFSQFESASSTPADDAALDLTQRVPSPDDSAYGTIKLVYNRFPSVAVDIAYRPTHSGGLRTWREKESFATPSSTRTPAELDFSDSDFEPVPSGPTAIVLNQSRRIKAKAVNYFDNPVFGVMVQIRSVKPPAGVPDDAADSESE
jgi:hypothetical protein